MNYKFTIQYDGTDFNGWQIQDSKQRTVQGELERVLSLLEDAPVNVIGSGRTDAGVHAEAQIANARLNRSFTPEKLKIAMNGNLWRDIRIMNVEKIDDDFHARFSAKGKTYIYRVVNAPVMSPFWTRFALHEPRPLDVTRMQEASRIFLGEHDWTAFSAAQSDVENRVRTVQDFAISSHWDNRANSAIIEFRISANSFLRYMVRSIVGTLLEVGRGEKNADTIYQGIIDQNRKVAGKTAEARGLTLVKVHYE